MFSCDPFHYHFAYVDDVKLWSKEIFDENKSHVRIRRTKKLRSTNELLMVFVSVKTTEQLDFIRAMRELKTQMILAGSKDYLAICDNFRQKCPKCGQYLVKRSGKYGAFLGCSGYPDCKYTE